MAGGARTRPQAELVSKGLACGPPSVFTFHNMSKSIQCPTTNEPIFCTHLNESKKNILEFCSMSFIWDCISFDTPSL